MKTLQEGLRIVRSSDLDSFAYALQELSTTLANAGIVDGALEVAAAVPNSLVQAYALRLIAVEQFKAGNSSRALQIVRRDRRSLSESLRSA